MKLPFPAKRICHILLLSAALLAAVALFYALAMRGIGIGCPFYGLTGFQCPGCGNSRAAVALLRLDFLGAFQQNPLCFVEFFYLAWVYFHSCRAYLLGKRFSYWPPVPALDAVALAAVALWGVIRNFL